MDDDNDNDDVADNDTDDHNDSVGVADLGTCPRQPPLPVWLLLQVKQEISA